MSGGFLYGSTATSGTKGESGNGTGTSTGTPSNNTSGSTVLTIDQIPAHIHYGLFDTQNAERRQSWGTGTTHTGLINGMGTNEWNGQFHVGSAGGGQGHTHTLSSHTHTIPYIVVYIWKRIS